MNNNYILARWRDASTDPPPEGKPRLVKSHHGVIQHILFERIGNRWTHADLELGDSEGWDGCDIEPGDQWLDITAIPGVPREAVQAAVDLMEAQQDAPLVSEDRKWNLGRIDGIECGKRSVFRHTGVTPTEVTNG